MTRNLLQPIAVLIRSFDVADKHLFASRPADDIRNGGRAVIIALVRNLIITFALVAPVGFAAEFVLAHVYGQNFTTFGSALRIWMPAFLLMAVIFPLETLLYSRQLVREYAWIIVLSGLVTLVSVYPLVQRFAVNGAIIACTIGYTAQIVGAIGIVLWSERCGSLAQFKKGLARTSLNPMRRMINLEKPHV
jgi:O-antigen/teichoic acid export membrane protein